MLRPAVRLLLSGLLLFGPASGAQPDTPLEPVTITVEGRLLSGPYTFAERRGQELLLPVTAIAQALGDTVHVDATSRTLTVRRQSGVTARLDLATGQIFENGQPVMVSTSALASIPPLVGDSRALLLPVDLVSALLQASVIVDPNARTLRVLRSTEQVMVSASDRFRFFDLYRTSYQYRGELSAQDQIHSLQLDSSARVVDGLATAQAHLVGHPPYSLFDFRQGLITFERPNGQRLMLGDFSTHGDVDVLAAAMRGAWYRQPLPGASDFTAFAGLARSGAPPDPLDAPAVAGLNFDTPLVGASYTFGREREAQYDQHISASAGGYWFNGPQNRAGIAGAAFRYSTGIHTFHAEAGVGLFDDLLTAPGRTQTGFLFGVTESITPTPTLTLLAGLRHISEGYRSATGSATLRPMNLITGGVSWRPLKWLSMSGAGRYQVRLDLPNEDLDYDLTGALVLAPLAPIATLSLSHSEGRQFEIGARSYSIATLSGSYGGTDYFANATQSMVGGAEPQRTLILSAGRFLTPSIALRGSQSFGSGGAVSGNLDVFLPAFFTEKVTVSTGVGYSYTGVTLAPTARLSVTAQLPWKQVVSLAVQQTLYGANGMLQIAGPLYDPPGTTVPTRYSIDQLGSLGSFAGRVYQDVDLNGAYEVGVDRALPGVQVLVDGSNAVYTDEQGQYRITNVISGDHTVFLNLLTVRADLSLLSRANQSVALPSGGETLVDFRLVRTGRASGLVWMDTNGNGALDEGETPLGQVRVVAGQRDTLTDPQGQFILGDLPQGQHRIVVDEKTLPEGQDARSPAVDVVIKPPRETRDVLIPVRPIPKEIEIREF